MKNRPEKNNDISSIINEKILDDLRDNKHSLNGVDVFPKYDDNNFLEVILNERLKEVVSRYKRIFDIKDIDKTKTLTEIMPLVKETMMLESRHKEKLIELAIKMVREEFDMDEDVVEINAELTPNITLKGVQKKSKSDEILFEFESYEQIEEVKKEVSKRRLINSMIQGASKKCNHMFHLVEDEISSLEPKLVNNYARVMSNADLMYFLIPDLSKGGVNGGVVRITFPTQEKPKAIINVQAMVFPVLIHELVKGVMELLSAHALPQDKKIGQYVIDKADYIEAECDDMRFGPQLWSLFTKCIDINDFHLKHHIYSEICSLPTNEFNNIMREIFANTTKAKEFIKEIADNVRKELSMDELSSVLETNDNGYEFDDFYNDDGFDFDEL